MIFRFGLLVQRALLSDTLQIGGVCGFPAVTVVYRLGRTVACSLCVKIL